VTIEDGKTTPENVMLRPKFGKLVVTSDPPDAEVILNGTPQGKAPLTLERVISGNYTLELHKDQYYYPETRSVKIEDGKTTPVPVTFRPRFGTLVIQSDPPDAEIIFDGTPKGKTPLTLERVISSNYTLELRKELYLDWTGTVQIKDGQTTTMPPIPLTPNFGTLEVNYKPEGATVYLNEKMIGNTPLPPVKLKPDTYSLRVTAGDKYRDVSPPVVLANGQTLLLEEELQRLKGGVKVLSNPPDADIYLNGGNLGITPKNMGLTPKVLKELDADDYTLKLTKEGYKNYTQTLRIREGMLPNIDVTLIKVPIEKTHPRDNAKMVLIPAGEFQMGCNDGGNDEKPVHTVYLDAFYMDKYEVTNAQYAKFLNDYGKNTDAAGHELIDFDDGNCLIEKSGIFRRKYRPKSGYENHPVVEVTWYGAAAYAQYYGKRLPTEAEWEKAARGGLVGKKYPWGDNITHNEANYYGTGGKDDKWSGTSPVGSFAPNGYGLYDMAGNVWEWCADEYDSGYYSKSLKNNPKGPGIAITLGNNNFTNVYTMRVIRGGAWRYSPSYLRCACRLGYVPTLTYYYLGFRCSQDQ
jgi:formylglycine-generating enzyme required for sulfatase activity